MKDKFTIRDFFAYIMCGCAFFVSFFITDFERVNIYLTTQKQNIQNYSTILIFASVPIMYLIGQIIQSIDTLFYFLSNMILKKYKTEQTKCKEKFYWVLASHRITGNLWKQNVSANSFWQKCNQLELVSKYGHCEYLYIMNDLFKGFTLINLFFTFYSLINLHLIIALVFLVLTMLTWLRAKYYAITFIDTVKSTKDALDNLKTRNAECNLKIE